MRSPSEATLFFVYLDLLSHKVGVTHSHIDTSLLLRQPEVLLAAGYGTINPEGNKRQRSGGRDAFTVVSAEGHGPLVPPINPRHQA